MSNTVRWLLHTSGRSSTINSVKKQILSSWDGIYGWGEEVKGIKRGDIQVTVIGVSTPGYCSTVLSQCPSVLLSARPRAGAYGTYGETGNVFVLKE